jgi:hypothetical protein
VLDVLKKGLAVLILLVSGVLLVVNYGRLAELWSAVPPDIIAEAKLNVREPTLPPPPVKTTEIVGYDEKYADVQVPELKSEGPFRIPQLAMRVQRVVIAREPRFVNKPPPTEAVAEWRSETARLTSMYQVALQKEINVIQTRRSKELRETLQSWVTIWGGVMGCLVGLVSLVVTVRKERRETLAAARKLRGVAGPVRRRS